MPILELNHVALHVADLDASVRFYGDILGLPRLPRPDFGFPGAWFRLGTTQELHLLVGRTDPVHHHHRGTHFALLVPSVPDAVAAVEAHGIPLARAIKPRPDGALQAFIQDPDGYYIEFCELARD